MTAVEPHCLASSPNLSLKMVSAASNASLIEEMRASARSSDSVKKEPGSGFYI